VDVDAPRGLPGNPRQVLGDTHGAILVAGADIAKYRASDGEMLWRVPLQSEAVALDSSADVLVAGFGATGTRITQKRSGSSGAPIWSHSLPTTGVGFASRSMAVDPAGNSVVADEVSSAQGTDVLLTRYGPGGQVLWTSIVQGTRSRNRAVALAFDAAGDLLVTGTTGLDSGGHELFFTAKLAAATGLIRWNRTLDGGWSTPAEVPSGRRRQCRRDGIGRGQRFWRP
jgi:outer membrane protein assembly factor BamB